MIQINKIKPFKCKAYSPEGKYLGLLNEYEFNDLRIQIKEQQIFGYYMLFNNEKILIDKNGSCENWPNGFYDLIGLQLFKIL